MSRSNYLRKRIKKIKQEHFRPVDATPLYAVTNFSFLGMLTGLIFNRIA